MSGKKDFPSKKRKDDERTVMKKDTLAVVAAVIIAALIIGGSILHLRSGLADRAEITSLRTEITDLQSELAKTVAMLDSALRTLHHERLHHFGTFDIDANAEKAAVSGDAWKPEDTGR